MSFEIILKNAQNIEDKNIFLDLLNKVSDEYYETSTSSLTDSQFDTLVSMYEKNFNEKYTYIGSKGDVKLPVFMPSLNKVKDDHGLNLYKKRCETSNYVIADKIDGLSILVVVKKGNVRLYTRGDGEYGKEVTNIYPYINIGKIKMIDHIVRGEIVMPLDKFEKYSKRFNNPRNLVAGAINSKEKNLDILRDLKFIAYSYCGESTKNVFNTLKELGYYTPYFYETSNISESYLRDILNDRKKNADYEIDGIVISCRNYIYENTKENPKLSVAFKSLGETKETVVLDVEWNVRKYNYLKPRVKTEPVFFGNVKVQYFSGYNGKYIFDNNIGPGTVLLVTRSGDVVPDILNVVKPTTALMPPGKFHWKGIELVSDDDTVNIQLINRLVSFFTVTGIKGMKEGIIKKIVEGRCIKDEIEFFNINKEDILKVDGFKDKSADNVLECINELKSKITFPYIMLGSCIFQGFGEKKISKIIEVIGEDGIYKERDYLINKILGIGGFNTSAEKFVDYLEDFKDYYELIKPVFNTIKKQDKHERGGKTYCFSGFRDSELKKKLEDMGFNVVDTISKTVNVLVVKDLNSGSSKVEKAIKYGIEIVEVKNLF